MGLSFLTGKNRVVNLVFKDHVIRYTELKQANPPVINAHGEYYLPPGIIKDGRIMDFDTLQSILEQCLDEWKINKRQVRFIVPDPFVVIRKVAIPKDIKDDEIDGYLYMELGASIHLPFEDPTFDTVMAGETADKKEILLFAAPEAIVSDYTALLQSTKLDPVAADISPLAIYRLHHIYDTTIKNEQALVLQFDLHAMNASIFLDNMPLFMRHVPYPDQQEWWEKANTRSGGISLEYTGDRQEYFRLLEDCYVEIERVLNFYKYSISSSQESVTKIYVNGDHPFLYEIISQMKTRFEMPISYLDTDGLSTAKGDQLPEGFYLAAGLGLKGVR
ncbi:type IV pilus biogenesis protein PilM [Peribacillus sp. SCS-155]|uniref:type IV pilus biogenesis protein PilM n=1 Tax=Peribacillus sedimenti TaxID=3115297 RepID=UPI003905B651